jgi:murein DD-endopeptidase MepM/ murein hydrolase activator NlpD
MADPGQIFKNYAKSIIKMAAKRAAKSFLRYLIATFGLPALAITLAVILVLVTIFAVLPASGILGSAMQTRTQAVAYYQQVTDQVNPQPQASLYQDLEESHLLNFGLLYSVDFFANNLSGANTFQSNAQALGEGLKPVFTYTQQTETITTITSDKNGTTKTVTKTTLTLLSKADTYQGIYTYTYEPYEYTLHPSTNERITIDTWRLSGSEYAEDWTRFDAVVEKYTGLTAVTDDDREMILQSAATLQSGSANLDWMMGVAPFNPGAGAVYSEIPPRYLVWFREAGQEYDIPWYVLAAIADVESDFNPDAIGPVNYTGELAEGMMQFLPSTWAEYGSGSPFDPEAAIFAAAKYLAAEGGAANIRAAIYDYNHADWYVNEVMGIADSYEEQAATPASQGGYVFPVEGAVKISSTFGQTQQGVDFSAPTGTPVLAFAGGTVSLSQNRADLHGQDGNGYIYVNMQDGDVRNGAAVQAGQVIGYTGQPDLLFEVEVNGKLVDPDSYLALASGSGGE